ncbi:EscF/YscF/HrpA family type III secretion system needle major subunit [Chromobacterium piscinae]|uniref:EscF/YscF/HrpA family type III secretion system needle major subunit n=1 Tax=Chromobacterium piscinae TaxID=686831 RepID=UPI0031FDD1DC
MSNAIHIVDLSDSFASSQDSLYGKMEESLDLLVKDPSNPQLVANYQRDSAAWELLMSTRASVVKSHKEVTQGVIQKL